MSNSELVEILRKVELIEEKLDQALKQINEDRHSMWEALTVMQTNLESKIDNELLVNYQKHQAYQESLGEIGRLIGRLNDQQSNVLVAIHEKVSPKDNLTK